LARCLISEFALILPNIFLVIYHKYIRMGLTRKTWVKFVILILIIGIFMLIKWANKKTVEGFAVIYTSEVTVTASKFKDSSGTNFAPSGTYNWPTGIVLDSAGNVYVANRGNNRIMKIDTSGTVTTFAGNNGSGLVDGTTAKFSNPYGLAIDSAGNIYVADSSNNAIRKITPGGVVSTVAGGTPGYQDGQGTNAKFNFPQGVVVDSYGNIYVADNANNRIRKIDTSGNVSTFAGGASGYRDGQGTNALFRNPVGIAIDSANNLYIADSNNNAIRKIDTSGNVITIGGTPPSATGAASSAAGDDGLSVASTTSILTRHSRPEGIALDSVGNVYVAEAQGNKIRKIDVSSGNKDTYKTTTLIGAGNSTSTNVNGQTDTYFNTPFQLYFDKTNNLYVVDSYNNRVIKVTIMPNCPAGQYAKGVACAPCESGYFNPSANQSSCQPCSPGSYSTLPSGSNTGATQCTPCTKPIGTQGMTSVSAATSSASCKGSSCDPGYGFDSNAGTCTACVPGKFSPGGTSICSNCPGSSYSTSNLASNCTPCGSNQYTASTGANSSNLCLSLPSNANFNILGGFLCMLGFSQTSSNCSPCAAGSYNSNAGASNCDICGVGTYSGATASNCTTCSLPPGTVSISSPSNSKSQDDCIASSCYPGYGYVSSKCVQCAGGFYGMGGTTTCSACPQTGYTTPLGSSNVSACYCANKSLPPKAQGSGPKLLAALNTCIPDGINVYNFTMGSNVTTMNPCTGQSFYDFDRQVCVDSYGNTVDGTSMTICRSNQVYSKDTNACQTVNLIVKPDDPQLVGTTGKPGPNNYNNCKTVDKGDCTILFKNISGVFTSLNPCLANGTIYNFDTDTCTVPKNPCCRFTTAAAAIAGGCAASTENPIPTRVNTTNPRGQYYCGGNNASTVPACKFTNPIANTYKMYWNIPPAQFTAAHKASCSASGFTDYTNSSIESLIDKMGKRLLHLSG
jgi:sugar lactone lactonase YvrE